MKEAKSIQRSEYLRRLVAKQGNGLVKIISGVRRCGKSYLLFQLFRQYLLESGVPENRIVSLALDSIENAPFRDPMLLSAYLNEKTSQSGEYFILLDEIQFVERKKISSNPPIYIGFYDVLNSLLQKGNCDIYVTGSNSKMLSSDIATEFRGRGDELHITPLTFSEMYAAYPGDPAALFESYMLFGGFPGMPAGEDDSAKKNYLSRLFGETYLKDIMERRRLTHSAALEMIVDELCSAVGSLTNASKIAVSLKSSQKIGLDSETVGDYLGFLTDAFLFSKANRFDVKGRRYFSYPSKYYCVDPGLRNARLNFRQVEETHLMENVIYNELMARGLSVDVGVMESTESVGETRKRVSNEIDFVVNADKPGQKCYIQSALSVDTPEKAAQEIRPFLLLKNDFSKRILITKTGMKPWNDEYGILHIGVYDFLLHYRFDKE